MSNTPLRAKEVFVHLISDVEPADWDNRLIELCAEDNEVRTRVRALLQAHRDPQSFLERPAVDLDETVEHRSPIQVDSDTQIGPYKLLQQIGEGAWALCTWPSRLSRSSGASL